MDDAISSQLDLSIQKRIHTMRGSQVMLDRDLAEMYGVETKVLNQAVKRNIERFPKSFCFQLSPEEYENWRSQFVTSNSDKMGLRRAPYAFTEQGVAMLSAVLKSKTAVQISILIMNAFVAMRKYISINQGLVQRIDRVEFRLVGYDEKFEKIFKALEADHIPKQGIFFDGHVFDAYEFAAKLVRSAKKSLQIIDNYADESVLHLLLKLPKLTHGGSYRSLRQERKSFRSGNFFAWILDLTMRGIPRRRIKTKESCKCRDLHKNYFKTTSARCRETQFSVSSCHPEALR